MDDLLVFKGIDNNNIETMLKCFGAVKKEFKRDYTITSNLLNTELVGIIVDGTANILKYDLNGNRTIMEKLEKNSVFGKVFSYTDGSMQVVATSKCTVLFIEYSCIINRCKKNCPHHAILTDNVLNLLSEKIIFLNDRLEVLSKRSTRDKLLTYFNLLSKKKQRKVVTLPFTYTELADYLSIDRSAMMREIKNMKDEGFISTNGRKITLSE